MPDYSGTPDIDIMPRRLMEQKKSDDFVRIVKEMEEVSDVGVKTHNWRGGGFLAGRFIVLLKEGIDAEAVTAKLKPVMDQMMPYGYDVRYGRFTKPRPTVKDYIREHESKTRKK
jgi:methyl coenzyme M reductase subunit D